MGNTSKRMTTVVYSDHRENVSIFDQIWTAEMIRYMNLYYSDHSKICTLAISLSSKLFPPYNSLDSRWFDLFWLYEAIPNVQFAGDGAGGGEV